MNYDLYSKVADRAKNVAANGNPQIEEYIEDVLAITAKYHANGLDLQYSARTLVEITFSMMMLMAHLEDSEAFACHVRDDAETTRKIISEHWPPPDQTKWPYT